MEPQNDRDVESVPSVQPWIGLAALTVGIALVAFLPFGWWMLSFLAIGLIAGLAARHIDVHRARIHFSKSVGSSEHAREVLLRKQSEARFTVLLHPIQLANKVWIDVPRKLNDGYSRLPLEEVAWRAFATRDHQLICINDGVESMRQDMLLSDLETWKELTGPLLDQSTRILVLPGATQGCLWAAQHLKSKGMIGKCVFVMPRSTFIPFERYDRYWLDTQAGYRSVGIELVDYTTSGGLFILDAEDCEPLFFIKPCLDTDQPLLTFASLLSGVERSSIGDPEWHGFRQRVAGELRKLGIERLSNADRETWSRYLLYQDKLFCFDNGMRHRLA